MNIGDLLFQLIMFIFLLGIIFSVYFLVRFLITKKTNHSNPNNIEEKLDRIIKLLEKDKME